MRYLADFINEDLQKKMVFVGGPRQVGKTTLSSELGVLFKNNYKYFNWDDSKQKSKVLKKDWNDSDKLLILDEIHKYPKWKNFIKGIFDTQKHLHSIFVTGSARLDVYKRGGDSLLGRYHYWRLHPFTLDELPKGVSHKDALNRLMEHGGFPEPFIENSSRFTKRWRKERFDRVIKEDVRDLEKISSTEMLYVFINELRTRVSGMVVLANIANDIQISPKTAKAWLEIAEKMYLVFVVKPYTKSLPRAIQKPPKVYFFDNGDIEGDVRAKFENLVASHLIKRVNFIEDYEGHRMELHYIRDKEGREVDFVISKDGKIIELIEVKYSELEISKSLLYYKNKLNVENTTQIVFNLKKSFVKNGVKVISAEEYFAQNIPWNINKEGKHVNK